MRLGLYSKILGAAALLAVSALPFAPAQAADPTLGTYYGSGNPTGDWTITKDTVHRIELGLRAVYRFGTVATVTGPGDYTVETGSTATGPFGGVATSCLTTCSTWNYNFSIDTGAAGLSSISALLTITGPGGETNSFNPLAIPDNNGDGIKTTIGDPAPTGTGPGGTPQYAAQNSENLAWSPVGLVPFNMWAAGTYQFDLDVYDAGDTTHSHKLAGVSMTVNAVPEPASMALLGAGLLGLGLVRRRRRG